MATANLTPIELILTAALSCACRMDSEAIQAWETDLFFTCNDLTVTDRERCLFDVVAAAMELADRGIEPDPVALFEGWMQFETAEYLMDAITA